MVPDLNTRDISIIDEWHWMLLSIDICSLLSRAPSGSREEESKVKEWYVCFRKHFMKGNYCHWTQQEVITWWRHQMETFSALLALCAGNSPVSGEFPAQRPVTRSFDVYFDLHLIKLLSKHSRGWWFETLSCPLWRHRNENHNFRCSQWHFSMVAIVFVIRIFSNFVVHRYDNKTPLI